MATFVKLQRKSGVRHKALIRDRIGHTIASKTFLKKADAKKWANQVEGDIKQLEKLKSQKTAITLNELANRYMAVWQGKDPYHYSRISYWTEQGYRYLVVSHKRKRDFNAGQATVVKDLPGQTVQVQRVINEETGEVELYCHSQMREKKEQAMLDRFTERFEAALQSLADGLHKKGTTKRYDKILERIGRLKEKYAGAAPYYEITVTPRR